MMKGMTKMGKIILIVSLALNLAVIGAFLGHRLWHWRGHHHHGLKHHILTATPETKRGSVEKILTAYKEKYPQKQRHFITKWSEIDKLLRADTFDRAAFQDAIDQRIAASNQRMKDSGQTIADIAELLTKEERIRVLDELKKKWRKRRRYRKHRH